MKEIYYNNIHCSSKDNILFEINPIFELIVGTNDYKINITKDYFDKYIKKGICNIKEYIKYNFDIFYCDENKFGVKDINNFPTLYISNMGINHIFDLIGKELFINLNKKWYFQIVFPIKELDPIRWIIGKIFLRKYPVMFSPYNRLIGFYIKPNNGITNISQTKEEKKIIEKINNSKNFFSQSFFGYLKIIIIAIIFTIIGLIIGKRIFFPRKIRANELIDDYYNYDTEKKIKKIIIIFKLN